MHSPAKDDKPDMRTPLMPALSPWSSTAEAEIAVSTLSRSARSYGILRHTSIDGKLYQRIDPFEVPTNRHSSFAIQTRVIIALSRVTVRNLLP